jgi:hypothetical protein
VTRSAGTPPRYRQAAALVRARIAAGDLTPGGPARATGFAALTCRNAINSLIKDGTLVPGPRPNARPRVAGPRNGGQAPADAARDLSAALVARRHAVGLTQRACRPGRLLRHHRRPRRDGPDLAVPPILGERG